MEGVLYTLYQYERLFVFYLCSTCSCAIRVAVATGEGGERKPSQKKGLFVFYLGSRVVVRSGWRWRRGRVGNENHHKKRVCSCSIWVHV